MAVWSLTVKERILLHLFDFNRFEDDYSVPQGVTQRGIADAAGIRVHHVTQNTRPLISDNLVRETTLHIEGRPRRQKAYFLTLKGKSRTASMRSSLLEATVPFRAAAGGMEEIPLSTVYHERRRGSSLVRLVEELSSAGYVTEEAEGSEAPETVDFSQDAPEVELFRGRENELSEVLNGLERTPVVVVTGIAGIGKSALGSKICELARGTRPVFWERIRPWTAPTDLSRNLSQFLKAAGRGRLHSLMRQSSSKELGQIEEALMVDLRGLGGLLVYDDVHLASEQTQDFLSILHLVLKANAPNSALLLTREHPPFYSRREVDVEESVHEVSLGALNRQSSEALLRERGVPELNVPELSRVSRGSPLFLTILAKARTEDELRRGLSTLEAYIAEEIEPALDEEERAVMQVASLFDIPVPARALLQETRSGTGVILSLHRKGLLDRAGATRFSLHDAVKAYFHEGLPAERRRVLVGKAGAWLLEEAERHEEEGDRSTAIGYLENAVAIETSSERRMRGLRRLGDLRFLSNDALRAESAYRRALGETEGSSERAMLHYKIARVLEFRSEYDETEEELNRGLALLPKSPSLQAAWLLVSRADLDRWRQDYDEATAGYERVWDLLPELPEDLALRATVANFLGLMKLYNPKERDAVSAKEYYKLGVKAARSESSRNPPNLDDPLWLSLAGSALACLQAGDIEEALEHVKEGWSVANNMGAPIGRLFYLTVKAWCLSECLGSRSEASGVYREAQRLAQEMGNKPRKLWLHRNLADLYRSQSRYFKARESQDHFLLNCGELIREESRVEGLALMVRLCVLCGDTRSAQDYLEEAEDITGSSPSNTSSFYVGWARGVLQANQGKAKEAREAYEQAIEVGPRRPWPLIHQEFLATMAYRGEFLLDYGRFLSSVGNKDQAEPILLQAEEEFNQLGRQPLQEVVGQALQALRGDE